MRGGGSFCGIRNIRLDQSAAWKEAITFRKKEWSPR